jgi:hypothetical protein
MFNIIMQGMARTEFYPFSQFNILNWKLEGECSASCTCRKKTLFHKATYFSDNLLKCLFTAVVGYHL